ncbi:MAG: hypothetical protein E7391_06285 [Ruminococcaceae bacterium]|nr:hypothetical protein [Oscillospiraceae bacterium]
MTLDFKNLIHLYYCAIYDKTPDKREYNIENILLLAKKHEILQSVFFAIKKLANEDKIKIEKDKFALLNAQIMSDIALNIRRKQGLYEAIEELEENGIKCCLLKGDSIGRLYANPHARVSGDIDILIDEKDEVKAIDILKNLEFDVKERGEIDHHFEAFSYDNAILEVHIKLYSDATKDLVFNGMINYSKDYVKITLPSGNKVNTLNVNDNAFYLTAHFLKHFIAGGVGLRQISDMLVFFDKYKNEIDFNLYFETFDKLRYSKLLCAVFKLGNDYFNLDFNIPYEISNEIFEKFLTCIEENGVFGNGDQTYSQFYNTFVERRSGVKNALEYKKVSKIRRIFPDFNHMKIIYPFLEKMPFLLPFTYFMRVFRVIFHTKKKKEINDKVFSIFKDFDII